MLTTMLNKGATEERVSERIAHDKPFALFLIDVDNFKHLNDTHGHLAGDGLLHEIAQLLEQNFRRVHDTKIRLEPGRIGGDEFLIMADLGVDEAIEPYEQEHRASSTHEQMDKIHDWLRVIEQQLLEVDQHAADIGIGFSIGSALFDPKHPVEASVLMNQADEAMYEDKEDKEGRRQSR
jgi:diguanylate cyclase (GGDEF)-like protein